MKPHRFSSISALLEYHAALRRASHLSADERAALAEIDQFLAVLTPDERASLDDAEVGGAAARRAERARRKLARELAARGILES
jgi:hypothetical protein